MKVLDDNSGAVLVMVLLFLLATIIIGITLVHSTITETKIVANEKKYNQDFYSADSAAEVVIAQFDNIVSVSTAGLGTTLDVTSKLPAESSLADAKVEMTLEKTGVPPIGSGMSATKTTAYYYQIDANVNNQSVEVGVWKAFPKSENK